MKKPTRRRLNLFCASFMMLSHPNCAGSATKKIRIDFLLLLLFLFTLLAMVNQALKYSSTTQCSYLHPRWIYVLWNSMCFGGFSLWCWSFFRLHDILLRNELFPFTIRYGLHSPSLPIVCGLSLLKVSFTLAPFECQQLSNALEQRQVMHARDSSVNRLTAELQYSILLCHSAMAGRFLQRQKCIVHTMRRDPADLEYEFFQSPVDSLWHVETKVTKQSGLSR